MREVIDLLSSDLSNFSLLDDEPDTIANTSYMSSREDSISENRSLEEYTYDFERLFSIKGRFLFEKNILKEYSQTSIILS